MNLLECSAAIGFMLVIGTSYLAFSERSHEHYREEVENALAQPVLCKSRFRQSIQYQQELTFFQQTAMEGCDASH
ncbi:hypothetical protein [Aliidiomarina celeris]|uniref:hypothetical protein n=1 Tax=Aliidiomarina celeris TaxID=2249428 RepID=UPI000DEBD5DA|nr:hypothetical protein [Aliidiomarina celeris]